MPDSSFRKYIVLLIGLLLFTTAASAQEAAKPDDEVMPTVAEKSADWEYRDGFQPFYHDAGNGKIWLLIKEWDREFLFSYGLATGLGSNPVGLDRGQLGNQLVCRFHRVGKKVFLTARNLDYRATSDNAIEQRSVRESFAESTLWGGIVAAETGDAVLVDVTGLMNRDLHGVVQKLKATGQGDFSLDESRSGIYLNRCKAFPDNSELEATLTFSSAEPGSLVRQVTPSANDVTLRQHLSFVRLPDDGYQPRVHHPRCASMHITFSDYATAIDAPLQKRWILRHRLQRTNPDAPQSTAVEPIVYYVDPGAPQLIREALIEGASWWNQAFEAAGFVDAFQVRVLPDDADPMDVRYNVIQWVHRSTRGWSYGGSVIDPRTGEIIKGHVTLGSLRVRQDRLLFDALGPRQNAVLPNPDQLQNCGMSGVAEEAVLAAMGRRIDPVEVALARIRQLSAHEVGHTLGFVHNFAASTWGDRASVMDYPAPRVIITEDGSLDLSDAYGVGIGAWDKWTVQFAYQEFPTTTEQQQLGELVSQAMQAGMTFVSDADARPGSAAHPLGNLWDNGTNPVDELNHVMRVRRIALDRLQPTAMRGSDPMGEFEQLFVPVYLHHRFQVDAAAKMIGGVEYGYETADSGTAMKRVRPDLQRQALNALLSTVHPAELSVRNDLWQYLVPKPYSSLRDIERFEGNTDPVFDRQSAARIAADMTIGSILNPQRFSRFCMTARDSDSFGPQQLMIQLIDGVWRQHGTNDSEADAARMVKQSLTAHLLELWASKESSDSAKAMARMGVDRVKQYLDAATQRAGNEERMFAYNMLDEIRRFRDRPWPEVSVPENTPAPPGSPIGDGRH